MGWIDTILTGMFVLIGMIMTFFILLQEGKGGGLAALGGTKAAGVEGVTNPIRRATAYLAGLFFILAIILGIMHKPTQSISIGSEPPPPAAESAGAGAGAMKATPPAAAPKAIEVKAADVAKPAEILKTDAAKPADASKTDAKPADSAKTEVKPAEKPADAVKPAEAPKTDAAKPADAPKTDAAKPAEEPKKADEKK